MPPKLSIDVDIDLPGRAYLPADYVPDQRLKIDVYRRISRVASIQELEEMREELHDRFGPSPAPVERMLALAELKMDAALWQVAAIRLEDKYMVFEYTLRSRIEQLSRLRKGKLRVVDDHSAYLTVPEQFANPEDLLRLAKSVLRPN